MTNYGRSRNTVGNYTSPGLAGGNRTVSIDGSNTSITPGLASYANTPANRVVNVGGGSMPNMPVAPDNSRFVNPYTNPYRNLTSPQNAGGGGLSNYANKSMGFSTAPSNQMGLAASGANNQGMSERDKQFAEMMGMNKTAMERAAGQEDINMAMKQEQMDMYKKAFGVDYKNQQTMARQMTA
jgi:hypothetical protein